MRTASTEVGRRNLKDCDNEMGDEEPADISTGEAGKNSGREK